MSKAIAQDTPELDEIPKHYIEFAKQLTSDDVVVTFNWDLLLEKAIQKAGSRFSYYFDESKIHIIKLHGSINWINNEPRTMLETRPDFKYRPLGFREGLMENESIILRIFIKKNNGKLLRY